MPVEVLFNYELMSLLSVGNFIKTKIPECVGETLTEEEFNIDILKNHEFIPLEIISENPL